MSASDHTSRDQFFHGTTRKFRRGDIIQPTEVTGVPQTFPLIGDPSFSYATTNRDSAWKYAQDAWMRADPNKDNGVPRVYGVEPLGDVEDDPMFDAKGQSRGISEGDKRSKQGFRVLKRYSMPSHMGREEEYE